MKFKIWELTEPSNESRYCYPRHAIAALLHNAGFVLGTISRVVGRARTTLYNSFAAHDSLIRSNDTGYIELLEFVENNKKEIINYVKGAMKRDLRKVYSIEAAYAYGYVDGAERIVAGVLKILAKREKLSKGGGGGTPLDLSKEKSEINDLITSINKIL